MATKPATAKPAIPNDYLGASSRQVIIAPADITATPKLADWGGGPSRSIVLLTTGVVAYIPDSPAYDPAIDGAGSDLITLPSLPAGTSLDIAVASLDPGATTATLLILF